MKIKIRAMSLLFFFFILFFINSFVSASKVKKLSPNDVGFTGVKKYLSYLGYTGASILTVGCGVVLYKNSGKIDNKISDEKHECKQSSCRHKREETRVKFDPRYMEIINKDHELRNLLDKVGGKFLSDTFKNYKNRFINSKNFSLDNLIEAINEDVRLFGIPRIRKKAETLCKNLLRNRAQIENLKSQINNL